MFRFFKDNFFPIDKIDKNEKPKKIVKDNFLRLELSKDNSQPKPKYIRKKQNILACESYGTFTKN